MQRFTRYCFLSTALLCMTLLVYSVGQRLSHRATSRRLLTDWDIPELADYLNRSGLAMRLRPTRRDGAIDHDAFLTTTDKDWSDLNFLVKDPSRIQEWQGIVYCGYTTPNNAMSLASRWGENGLLVGPFVLYGNAELLSRIDAALK